MKVQLFANKIVPVAFSLLPAVMGATNARAMVTAICLQESGLTHRRQVRGPARSYAQFEIMGVREALTGRTTRVHAEAALAALDCTGFSDIEVLAAIEHNDMLAVVLSRLLLWGDPAQIPGRADEEGAWQMYLRRWRPGKPHRERWGPAWHAAWAAIEQGDTA
jgi:hypothetical protein